MKIAICGDGLQFIQQIADKLQERGHEIIAMRNGVDELCRDADLIWIEWATNNARAITHDAPEIDIRGKAKVIVRFHGIDVYQEHYRAVDWNLIDSAVFVSDHLRRKVVGGDDVFEPGNFVFPDKLPIHVVSNAFDSNKWTFKHRDHGFNIAYVGNFIHDKGLMYMLPYIEQLFKKDDRWKLYMIGDSRNRHILHGREGEFFFHFLKINNLLDRVIIEPEASSNLDLWYEDNDINYVIVPSSRGESFSMVAGEAMLKGIKPLISNWWGADELWPEELLFKNIDEFNKLFEVNYDSEFYRKFVYERYDIEKVVDKIESII